MNELQIFNSEEFGDIRTVTINNEPWFVGKDVATALGYQPCFMVMVGAARDMDEDIAREVEEVAQPELPKLKNNDQRKEFLKTYRDWPVWFEVPQADEVYYRYILPDGSAIVICEYKQYVAWKERYTDENPESTYTKSYLLEPGYHHLHDCETNETALVKKLMEVQKR